MRRGTSTSTKLTSARIAEGVPAPPGGRDGSAPLVVAVVADDRASDADRVLWIQQCSRAVIVTAQLWTRMVQYKRKYEFFYKAKYTEISIASDLIEYPFLFF